MMKKIILLLTLIMVLFSGCELLLQIQHFTIVGAGEVTIIIDGDVTDKFEYKQNARGVVIPPYQIIVESPNLNKLYIENVLVETGTSFIYIND